jgi:hypothetical protein
MLTETTASLTNCPDYLGPWLLNCSAGRGSITTGGNQGEYTGGNIKLTPRAGIKHVKYHMPDSAVDAAFSLTRGIHIVQDPGFDIRQNIRPSTQVGRFNLIVNLYGECCN